MKGIRIRPEQHGTRAAMTTITRLHDKGLFDRRAGGRRHLYRAKYSRDAFTQTVASKVLDSFDAVSRDAAMALLVDRVSCVDADELARLEQMIRARRKELRGPAQRPSCSRTHP